MSTLVTQNIFGGPAYVLIGDPVTALGADMTPLGRVPNVEVQAQFMRQSVGNEIGQPLADGQYGACVGCIINLSMLDKSAAILAELMPEISVDGTATIFGTDFTPITTQTIVIIPEADKALGPTNGVRHIWIPGAVGDNLSSFQYQLTTGQGTNDDGNQYTVDFRGTLKSTDSNSDPLTEGYRILFIGDPDSGVTWTLPSPYTP